jgi:4-aminobutyrate aminotransferase-like enzyme/Ser/Thr protein kinase RdoA (MazF antagonist)
LLALRTSPPSLSTAEGERIARDSYGLAVSIDALPGERDCNFKLRTAAGREFVLKIFAPDGESGADCLARVLEFLAESDPQLPVPRLIPTLRGDALGQFARDGLDYPTCLVSYLPGELLLNATVGPGLLQNVGVTLARIDRALQGFFHPTLGRALAWDVRRLPQLLEFSHYIESPATRAAVAQVSNALRDRLSQLRSLRAQAIHGDCHARNLLTDSQATTICGILDFGDMIHAPPIIEVGISIAELMSDEVASEASSALLLYGFAQGQSIQALEVDLLFDIIAARYAATILLYAWRTQHDAAGAALLEEESRRAAGALTGLLATDRQSLTRAWHAAAGTAAAPREIRPPLERRHRLMGGGAELFYEQPLHIVRGDGLWLYDASGRAYLDVYNNVAHVGHCHPTVVNAIQRQTALLATHTRYLHEGILNYAQALTARLPPHLDTCIFVNSGSEANDVAWRIAKMHSGHAGALIMQHAYHGITDAVGALTPGSGQPSEAWVVTLSAPSAQGGAGAAQDCDLAIATLAERGFAPAAFFIDSALTSSGIHDPPPAWGAAIAARVRAAGALLVADEVQYGLGRSGSHFWGFERRGLSPDIITMGKPVGNGYPMGVVIANRAVIEAFQSKFGFFSTFGGNAVAAAAGLAVLEVLEQEQLMQNAETIGGYLHEQLQKIAARHACLGEVRGNGLLQGLSILGADIGAAKLTARRIVNALASEFSVLVGTEGPHGTVLKLRPPLPFAREHADLLIGAIDSIASGFN